MENILLPSLTGRGRGVGLLVVLLLVACSHIDEDERLIYVAPAEVQRAVLIEDFTGQRCVNCPTATEAIHVLQQQYGEDNVIAVAIHSGPFAHRSTMGSAFISDLGTVDGDDYFTHWGIEGQPGVKINRGAPIYDPSQYASAVATELQKTSPEYIENITAVIDADNSLHVSIVPEVADVPTGTRLQVWLIEDSINVAGGNRTYVQFMPDGSTNIDYVHNHVFRASLTDDLYGDSFSGRSILESSFHVYSYLCKTEALWNARHLSVVVFLWNDQEGVIEVKRAGIDNHSQMIIN